MSHTKKLCAVLLALVLALSALTACGEPGRQETGEKRPCIVTTIFPIYDWIRQILGDQAGDVDLVLLLDSGVDLHSYQPSVDDMVTISTCDLFVYVGGLSDQWARDAVTASDWDIKSLSLLDALGDRVKEEETVEGMEPEEEIETETEAGPEETEYDEHVWLSLRNAAVLCEAVAVRLGEMDEAGRDLYAANAAAYIEKLNALDRQYADMVDAAPRRTLLFGDRFPFCYLVDDYGLDYYAAFSGCSAETEASFTTIVFLADKVDELDLHVVLTTESADGRIAKTIVENTAAQSAEILQLDSMQSVTEKDIADGLIYLDVMERNLETLREALE